MLEEIKSFEPHHIFIFKGDVQLYAQFVIELHGNDHFVYTQSYNRFTMDNALDLRSFINDDAGVERYCVVYFTAFSPDAAEVLLKTLEEPPLDARIIFITPYPYLVPHTIRSRVMVNTNFHKTKKRPLITKGNIAEFLKQALGDEKDEAALRRERAFEFLDLLEESVADDPEKAIQVFEAKELLIKGNLPSKQVLEFISSTIF